jgi:hypothetical protein
VGQVVDRKGNKLTNVGYTIDKSAVGAFGIGRQTPTRRSAYAPARLNENVGSFDFQSISVSSGMITEASSQVYRILTDAIEAERVSELPVEATPDFEAKPSRHVYKAVSLAISRGIERAEKEMEEDDESLDEDVSYSLPLKDVLLAQGTRQQLTDLIVGDDLFSEDIVNDAVRVVAFFKPNKGFHLQVYGSEKQRYRDITVRDFTDIR